MHTGGTTAQYTPSTTDRERWRREDEALAPLLRSIPAGASVIRIDAETGNRLPAPSGAWIEVGCQAALGPTPFPDALYAVVTDLFDLIGLAESEAVLQKLIAARVWRIMFVISFSSAKPGALPAFLRDCRRSLGIGTGQKRTQHHPHGEQEVRDLLRRLSLTINAETEIAVAKGTRTVLIDATVPPLPAITLIERCIVRGDRCEIDGEIHPVYRGCLACYVPDLGFKLLYGVGGKLHCIHGSAPDRQTLFAGRAAISGRAYTAADWLAAFSKKITRRAAENCVAATRLSSAGLGPAVRGCVAVREFIFDDSIPPGESAGVCIDNLETYRRKRETTTREMIRAGVEPDRIRSALRQQIRGYVSDLNSVVGVMPINADGEVVRLETALDSALAIR